MSRQKRFLSIATFCLTLLFAVSAAAALPDSGRINDELSFLRLDEGVFVITHEVPWPSNELLMEMADSSLVLINTPNYSDATRELLAWIRAEFGPRRIVAVNGHFHNDCLGGNAALIEAGIPIYGTYQTRDMLAARGDTIRKMLLKYHAADSALARRIENDAWLPPDHLFQADSGLVLHFRTDSLVLYYPGPAHSLDNIVAWFPWQKVLFGGCMIITWDRLGYTGDADLAEWPNSLENLKRFPAKWLIPGHGRKFTPDLIKHTKDVLTKSE